MSEIQIMKILYWNKKEFIVTYPTDYYGALTYESIINFFNNGNWEYCISKEKGHGKRIYMTTFMYI